MKKKYQNAFFVFGVAVLAVMVTQLDFAQVWQGLKHAGYWFVAVMLLWAVLYVLNTASWYLIIKGVCQRPDNATNLAKESTPGLQKGKANGLKKTNAKRQVPFAWLYKITVSGFALNYATPGGLMGGEPYRIMALTPKIGVERASSSVILYVMTHIFSHFWFWLLSLVLLFAIHHVGMALWPLAAATGAFCVLGIMFFVSGYRKGMANRLMAFLRFVPIVRRWARPFVEKHRQQLDTIDSQIAALHRQNKVFFVASVLLELACRVASALEIYFVLLVLMPSPSYLDCILILAFTSLFANLLFSYRCNLVVARAGSSCRRLRSACQRRRASSWRSSSGSGNWRGSASVCCSSKWKRSRNDNDPSTTFSHKNKGNMR